MLSIKTLAIALLPLLAPTNAAGTAYVANLGEFGSFNLTISPDESTMSWNADLQNIDMLLDERNATNVTSLQYHLHQQWTLEGAFSTDECGTAGGHYDPYFACGPASALNETTCNAIGRPKDSYSCENGAAYAAMEFDRCEVGDLNGKYGLIDVTADGTAQEQITGDPLPALNWHFVDGTTSNTPAQFSSIVFHYGIPPFTRILCSKLVQMKLEEEETEPVETSSSQNYGSPGTFKAPYWIQGMLLLYLYYNH